MVRGGKYRDCNIERQMRSNSTILYTEFELVKLISDVFILFAVVNQKYKVQVHDEYVMSGNTAVLKCQVTYVSSDFSGQYTEIIDCI